ncbi:hypothetical protein JXD20_00600 [Candidatus Peregrinibacteria bacterium]|nr:hypothetical protein [Candidatus Peregrinibacteria bacterium]
MHARIQQEATEERELVDRELKARKTRRKIEGRLAIPEELEEEEILKKYRPSTVDEALTRVRNHMAEIDHERGITVGGERSIPPLQPRMHPDRWRRGDPEDMEAYSQAFAKRQRAEWERREREYNSPEAVQRRKEVEKYRAILARLKRKKTGEK